MNSHSPDKQILHLILSLVSCLLPTDFDVIIDIISTAVFLRFVRGIRSFKCLLLNTIKLKLFDFHKAVIYHIILGILFSFFLFFFVFVFIKFL